MADQESVQPEATIRLEDYLRIIWSRGWIIILAVLIVTGVTAYVSFTTTPLYRASAQLIFSEDNLETAVSGYTLYYQSSANRDRTIQSAVAAIDNDVTLTEAVKGQLGSAEPASKYMDMAEVETEDGSDVVVISAVSPDPAEAADVANAYADQFIIYRQNADRAAVVAARTALEEQIATLDAADYESGYALMLQEKAETLRILESMQDGRFAVLSRAAVPDAPYTPQTTRNLILALVLGLVLGIGLAFLVEYLDKRIKDEKTLEKVTGLPVLTSVPAVGGMWHRGKQGRRSVLPVGFEGNGMLLLESFRALRSSLQYFDIDGTLHTILVTSGLPQEGKTVTTVNLAISLALSGKRVIVLEADLRKPMVHEYLRLENKVGLSSVLAGQCSAPAALQLVLLDTFIPPKARKAHGEPADPLTIRKNLYCLTSGPLPPNPTELLGSARMAKVISELKHMADYLLIDTPPVLPVSDVFTLAPHVDGVIVAARLNSSTRDEMEAVRTLLERANVRVIGVVAGGVKAKRGRYYYYRGGYNYGYGYQ